MSDEKPTGGILNARTLLLAATLFAGSSTGGGAVSYATSGRAELVELKTSVDTVAIAAVEIKAELRSQRKDITRLEGDVKENRQRILKLEQGD